MPPGRSLLVTVGGRQHLVPPDGRSTVLGSDRSARLRVAQGPPVWLTLRYAAGWSAVPAEGTSVEVTGAARLVRGVAGPLVARLDGEGSAWLRLSSRGHALEVGLEVTGADPGAPPARAPVDLAAPPRGPARTIGRLGHGADLQLPGDDVAKEHASARWDGRRLVVRDLQRGTGTFVGGRRVLRAPLAPGERFVVGHHELTVGPGGSLTHAPVDTPAALSLAGVSVQHHGQGAPTVAGVTFDLPAGGLLAVLGPSGVGKSSLCAALLGEAAMTGWASLSGQPLGDGTPPNPNLVSFVPQGGSAVPELTVEEALDFTARLRLAADVSAPERRARVAQVLTRLQLDGSAGQRVTRLSGGQSRRLAIAMELLTRPALLMLDEPTSGLDEGLDRHLMRDLAELAREGCVVVVVTHATAHLGLASHVLAMASGRPAPGQGRQPSVAGYFGPPEGMLEAFGASETADVMDALRSGRVAALQGGPLAASHAEPHPASSPVPGPMSSPVPRGGAHAVRAGTAEPRRSGSRGISPWRALAVSTQRERQRLARRWPYWLALTVLGPAVVGAISAYTGRHGLGGAVGSHNPDLGTSLAVAAICLSFLAMALSVTAVTTDLAVIDRERRWSVRASSVVLSRAAVRVALAVVQALVASVLLTVLRPAPTAVLGPLPAWVGVFGLFACLTVASTCVGILIGALSASVEQAVGLMSAALAGMTILCGMVIPLGAASTGFVRALSVVSYLAPTRWAVSAVAAYVDAPAVGVLGPDAMWTQSAAHVGVPALVLALTAVLALVLAALALPRTLARAARR